MQFKLDSEAIIENKIMKLFPIYSFRIQGTDNVHDTTIAAANKVCDLFLGITLKGDTIVCSLGAGHNSAHISITRNVHVSNFINTLHRIKDKTGLYIIITASKYDWLEYAGGNTTYEDLFVTPNKNVINTLLVHGVTNGMVLKAIIKLNIGSPCQTLFWHPN